MIYYSRAIAQDWQAGYEKLTDMIVPRSSQLITQDSDFALFNVTLFKKVCLSVSTKNIDNRLLTDVHLGRWRI